MQIEKTKAVQEISSIKLDEIQQMQHSLSALREELETRTFTYQQVVQNIRNTFRDEIRQLEQTIVALRQELEEGPVVEIMENPNG